MNLKVSVCPHDIPKKNIWKKFFKNLSKLLDLELVFEEVQNFQEEFEKIEKKEFALYYASPSSAYLFYKKGYIPVAKFSDQIDKFLIVGSNNLREDIFKRDFIKVAALDNNSYILPLISFSYKFKIDFSKIQILLAKTHEEISYKIDKGECDFAVVYQECFDYHPECKRKVRIFEEFTLGTNHYFMLRPDLISKEKVLKALEKIEPEIVKDLGYKGIEFFEKEDITVLEDFFFVTKLNFEILKTISLQEVLLKSPFMGIFIYSEKIVYANSYLCEILEYAPEEIRQLKIEELIYFEEDKRKVREVVKRRLKGEQFLMTWQDLVFKTKKGKKVYGLVSSTTIFYEGKFCGFVIVIDVTKRKHLETLFKILREINQTLVEVESEKEFFKRICKSIVDTYGLKLAWVGIPDYEKRLIKPVYIFGVDESEFQGIKISMDENLPEGRGAVGKAYRENKIQIIDDIKTHPNFSPWREPALKRGYRSVAVIPLKIDEEIKYILALYADEPFFFEEENREILEEMRRDIEFGVKKIEILRREKIFAETLRSLEEVVISLNQEGTIMFINEKGCEILGRSQEELIGKPIGILGFKFKGEPLELLFKVGLDRPLRIPASLETPKGSLWFDMKIRIVKLDEELFRYVLIAEDVSQLLEFEDMLEKSRFMDPLTELLNYEGFRKKVENILSFFSGEGILILLDLCDFTYINTKFGYEGGDLCLEEIAKRLEIFKKESFISRAFSDTFAFFFYHLEGRMQIFEILKTLKDLISKPMKLKDETVKFSFNAGIAIFPQDGKTFEELWKNANIALSEAKRKEKGAFEVYSPLIGDKLEVYFKSESLIKRALEENLFTFYYQPYFDVNTLKMVGVEALVRIKEKDGNLHLPSEFLEYLEDSPYLKDFEEWGMKTLKERVLKWKISVSFNISARSSKDLEFVKELIKKFKSKQFFKNLIIEITERVVAHNVEEIKEIVKFLKAHGIRVALDDFGIGYSSLSYLKDIPFDILKIDRVFIKEMLKSKKEVALVKNMVDLGHSFDMKVLAEGVETKEQLNYLDIMGCDYVQGFYLAKPMPEEELERLLSKE